MSVTINGTTGITTPDVTSDGLTVDTTTLVVDETNNRVGVGTSSPGAKLQVTSGGAYGPGSNLAQNLGQFTSSGGIAYVTMGNADSANQCRYIGAASAIQVFGKVTDAGSTTEHMRIDSSGALLINRTTQVNSERFAITGNTSSQCMALVSPTTAGYDMCNIINGNGQVGVISTSGTSTTYSTSSDYRLKENVAPMTGALDTVAQLKPCTYTWKTDGSTGQGFIAHELQAVVPDCVTGEKDAVDADGNPVYQGIDTSFLVATLTAAIQELSAKNDALEARIAALEASNV